MKNRFLDSGIHYDLLINWEKRLETEIRFLLDIMERNEHVPETILDVGCGTGRHADDLVTRNYKVTGIDVEESMIIEARKRSPGANFITGDFLDESILKGVIFDSIISFGNSVGLMAQSSGYEEIIAKFSTIIRKPAGLLIFQTLNFERERNGWSKPRYIIREDGEYIFLRKFATSEKHVHPEIVTLFKQENNDEWEMDVLGPANIPRINSDDFLKLLKKYDFTVELYGDYKMTPYDSEKSVDMVFVAKTR
ncbi:MAG: class I SAM-dependent methyltransferase [Candidatus Hodarchaeales archaeon]|jgi:SAM-dependent methyltransferase